MRRRDCWDKTGPLACRRLAYNRDDDSAASAGLRTRMRISSDGVTVAIRRRCTPRRCEMRQTTVATALTMAEKAP